MKRENEIITLDGNETGICVKVISEFGNERWIRSKQEYTRLFKNIAIAEVTAKSIAKAGSSFEYYVSLTEDKLFKLDDCQKNNNHWEAFDDDGNMIKFAEDTDKRISKIGYIVFDKGDEERTPDDIGIKRSKELMRWIKTISSGILYENGEHKISKIIKKNHEIVIHVVNTATIHILTPSRLMDINYFRKINGEKAIPFEKCMDKYSTLFVYICKDPGETDRIGSDIHTDSIFEYIMNDLSYYYPESNPRFISIRMPKYLLTKEEYRDGKNCQNR